MVIKFALFCTSGLLRKKKKKSISKRKKKVYREKKIVAYFYYCWETKKVSFESEQMIQQDSGLNPRPHVSVTHVSLGDPEVLLPLNVQGLVDLVELLLQVEELGLDPRQLPLAQRVQGAVLQEPLVP